MNPIHEAIEAERARTRSGLRRPRAAFLNELREHMGEALAYRMGVTPESAESLRWVGQSLPRLTATLLDLRNDHAHAIGPHAILQRGIASGDVPALLQGAGNRVLRQAYESYPAGLQTLCRRRTVRDFRDVKSIATDSDASLTEVREGVFTNGTVKASAETYSVSTFGRILSLSRTLLAEDDLLAFADLTRRLGMMAAEFVAAKVVALLENPPTMGDGVAVFNSAHANLGTAGALSETTLAELLKLLRAAKGLGGESISAVPKALVVPPALEFSATKLVALLGNPRPIEVVVEPRLTSATAFYCFADPATVPAIEISEVAGGEGPVIEVRSGGVGRDGLNVRVHLDVGCGFIDYRGAVKNAGA